MYKHTILVPKILTFERELVRCPDCGKMMEKHIFCDGARFHVSSWDSNGKRCSCKDCEINHIRRHHLERSLKKVGEK